MPNVGDELHHFGWNRCSSACHGPDRSHLIVPGFRSSRIHVAQRGRGPAAASHREGHRAAGAGRQDGLHAAAHRALHAGRQRRRQHARRSRRRRRRRFRGPRRTHVRGQGPLGERRRAPAFQLRLLVSAAPERRSPHPSSASPTPTRRASTSRTSARGATAAGCTSGTSPSAVSSRRSTSARPGLLPFEVRWLHDPDADEGFVGAALSSTMWHFRRDNGSFTADTVIAVENVELDGWPLPGGVPGADHRPARLDGRPLPVLHELAARRPAPVRHLRPRQPPADRPAVARWAAR